MPSAAPASPRPSPALPPAARAQLTLVEHAICPLDRAASLRPGLIFQTQYAYTDKHRNRRDAKVRVGALDGLSAYDELYLWGLLALALSQPQPRPELLATPYYCLRHLGLITGDKRGGREFDHFRAAIHRLAGVRYQNDYFYDPIRGEHRQVSFGFLNYSLPLDAASSRAWRFAWDPIFFEFAQATGGALSFDLTLYRRFEPATRRLYLYLKKIFWRNNATGALNLRHLAVDVLGFQASLEACDLRKKVTRCLKQLVEARLLGFPDGVGSVAELFTKQRKGEYTLRLQRGPGFLDSPTSTLRMMESPLVDPLRSIGFDNATIGRLLTTYPSAVLEQWADITLAARERNGEKFFTSSAPAYFLDNMKAAAAGTRTPPDWWRDLRKQELQRERDQERSKAQLLKDAAFPPEAFDEYLKTEAKDAFARIMAKLETELQQGGQDTHRAHENADYMTRLHFWNKYRKEHPDVDAGEGFQSLSSLI